MVAIPPPIDNSKSSTRNESPSKDLYDSSLMVTSIVLLSVDKDTDDMVGGVLS